MWFIAALIWGSLSAQFLVQVVTSLIIACVYLGGLMVSRVRKSLNAMGTVVSVIQAIVFTALLLGGSWFASVHVDYTTWNANSIASAVTFLLTISYCVTQVPDKLLLAHLSAREPYFVEAANTQPASERVAFARKFSKRKIG